MEGVREWKAALSGSPGLGSGGVAATWPTDAASVERGETTDRDFKHVPDRGNPSAGSRLFALKVPSFIRFIQGKRMLLCPFSLTVS